MNHGDEDTTIGTGGWSLVALAGIVTFSVLRFVLKHDIFPAAVFALAIALIVLLVLYRLAIAVNRSDDEEEAARVRRIVPGTALSEGGARVSGVEGARAPAARAVRVSTEPGAATPAPLPLSPVVTPLAAVEPAPLIAPRPVASAKAAAETPPPAPSPVPPKVEAPKVEKPKAAAKPKPKPKAATKPATKSWTEKPAAKAKAEKPAAAPAGLVRLATPRNGRADDLKEIEGIGPALEKLVNGMGFYHFDQIAAWTEADVAMVDAEMKSFKGRISRDRWVAQARIIVTEGLEAFRERAKTNNY